MEVWVQSKENDSQVWPTLSTVFTSELPFARDAQRTSGCHSSTHHAYHSSQKNLAHFTTHIAWKTWKNLIHLVYSVLSHKPNVHNIKCVLKPISSLVIPGLREMLMFNKCMLSSRCQNFVWTKKANLCNHLLFCFSKSWSIGIKRNKWSLKF